MAPILGYWSIRSLAQPMRNLLIYKGVEFEDKQYKYSGPMPDVWENWCKEKFALGLKYPNLPYYIDGDVKITESLAILRYLGRKHDMAGSGIQSALMAPVLGYWNLRSLGQPIRNLLIYKGVEFEDKQYKVLPASNIWDNWFKEKFALGLKYPNLPYYIDGDVKITESLAILRYLGRKHNLAGRNEEETIELDMLEQRVRDLYLMLPYSCAPVARLKYSLESYAEKLDDFLGPWDELLAHRKWVMGDRMTFVDFLLYEGLDWHREFKPDAVKRWPNIIQYLEIFEELPNIKEYFASDKYNKWPILGPHRPWGSSKPSEGDE